MPPHTIAPLPVISKCHSCAACVSGQNLEHLLPNDDKSRNFHALLAGEDGVINDRYSRKFRGKCLRADISDVKLCFVSENS